MSKFYIKGDSEAEGSPVRIYERDGSGQLLAEYKAFYDYKTHTYRCYPTYNPYAVNNGKTYKQTISANIVCYE